MTCRWTSSEAICASISEVSGTPGRAAVADAAAGGEAHGMTSVSKNARLSSCLPRNVSWFALEVSLKKPVRSFVLKIHLMMVARASPFMLAYVPPVEARARSRASAALAAPRDLRQIRVLKNGNMPYGSRESGGKAPRYYRDTNNLRAFKRPPCWTLWSFALRSRFRTY